MERKKYKNYILNDLQKKMVFIVGPRQVGKTWLAKDISKNFKTSVYLNYDNFEDRNIIINQSWLSETELIIFDELHKMKQWKNFIKGIYDTKPSYQKILVTGSARLDFFRQSGDSLTGRYFLHHLMPFTIAEFENELILDKLINRSGFPEPFLSEDEIEVKRWRKQYIDTLIKEEILEIERINQLKELKLIFEILRRNVGSPVSFKSIAEDVQLSVNTVKKYVNILETLFLIFIVKPFSKNIARAILKMPKIYFYDTGLVIGDNGKKFENFIAISLLKDVYARNDYLGENRELCYIRTKDGREIDFCIVADNEIEKIIECKYSKSVIDKNLNYFTQKHSLQGLQIVKELKQEYEYKNIRVLKASNFLKSLYMWIILVKLVFDLLY